MKFTVVAVSPFWDFSDDSCEHDELVDDNEIGGRFRTVVVVPPDESELFELTSPVPSPDVVPPVVELSELTDPPVVLDPLDVLEPPVVVDPLDVLEPPVAPEPLEALEPSVAPEPPDVPDELPKLDAGAAEVVVVVQLSVVDGAIA